MNAQAHWQSLSASQQNAFLGCVYAFGVLGLLGTLSVVLFYSVEMAEALRKRARRRRQMQDQAPFFVTKKGDPGRLAKTLIVSLAISDFIVTISFMLSIPHPEFDSTPRCLVQATLQDLSELAQFWIVASYSHHLYMVFIHQKSNHTTWSIVYFSLIFGYPLLWIIVNLSAGFYGPAGLWCWIKDSHTAFRWIEYYGLVIGIFVFNLVLFIIILRKISELKRQYGKNVAKPSSHSKDPSVSFQFTLYILVYLITKFPGIANRVQNEISPGTPSYAFEMAQITPALLQGFLDSIIYNFTFCRRRWRMRKLQKNKAKDPSMESFFSRAGRASLLDREYGAPIVPPSSRMHTINGTSSLPVDSRASSTSYLTPPLPTATSTTLTSSTTDHRRSNNSKKEGAAFLGNPIAFRGASSEGHGNITTSTTSSSLRPPGPDREEATGLLQQLEADGSLVQPPERPSYRTTFEHN